MKKICLLSSVMFIMCCFNREVHAQSKIVSNKRVAIIPQPVSVQVGTGDFQLSSNTRIYVDRNNQELRKIAAMLAAEIKSRSGHNLGIMETQSAMGSGIYLTLGNPVDSLGKEGYHLMINKTKVVISGNKGNGIFYGIQTLLQLLPVNSDELSRPQVKIPCVDISDKPRFEWRGLMLDVGRYYYSMDFLKQYIDYLSMHKLNTFHWHLVEDHGWRLEIKKYPRLTEVGAWREGNQFDKTQVDNTPKGGYYTQEQAKELVKYAAARYVTIVPEIELPGHSLSALTAYPELSCTGGPFKMLTRWGIQKDIYCAGNEQTFEFLENVLSEVASIFPGNVIHIGGDEAPKDRWKVCAKCQQRIKNEGLKDEHELQSYFIKRIEKFLLTKNKTIIGWDEILEGGLAPNASVMSWRGVKGGIEAAKQSHSVVMTPTDFYYFDYYQGKPYLEPLAISSRVVTLEKVYGYEPLSDELTAGQGAFIKGVQGNIWSEFIHSPDKALYMTYPRAAALAETAWSPAYLKNWDDFKRRMEYQYKRYDLSGINYARSAYTVWQTSSIDTMSKKATITFKTDSFEPEIRYTLDGNEPGNDSPLYTKPFTVSIPVLIKAATFSAGKRLSKISEEAVIIQ